MNIATPANSKLETLCVGGVCSGLKARNHGEIESPEPRRNQMASTAPHSFAALRGQGLRRAPHSSRKINSSGGGMARHLPPWAGSQGNALDPGQCPGPFGSSRGSFPQFKRRTGSNLVFPAVNTASYSYSFSYSYAYSSTSTYTPRAHARGSDSLQICTCGAPLPHPPPPG
jgi:hypothetical protein